jgi:Ca2+-binding RTX toxin-like protein
MADGAAQRDQNQAYCKPYSLAYKGNIDMDGTPGNDTITGTDGNDLVRGLAGSDEIDGRWGNDTLLGGSGNDFITTWDAGLGDSLNGGSGSDRLQLTILDILATPVTFDGSSNTASWTSISSFEQFTITGGQAGDRLVGGSLNDFLDGYLGSDTLIGGAGNDTIKGTDYGDIGFQNEGMDTLIGGAGNDYIRAGAGDSVDGGSGIDYLELNFEDQEVGAIFNGNLRTQTTLGARIRNCEQFEITGGFAGSDRLTGGKLNDSLYGGGTGSDTLAGGAGDDYIQVSMGDNQLAGGSGNDTLSSFAGHNVLSGDTGNDSLTGGIDGDTLTGGSGNDIFHFPNLYGFPGSGVRDVVTDFTPGQDLISVSFSFDSGITEITFEAIAGYSNSNFQSEAVLIYDPLVGNLFYNEGAYGIDRGWIAEFVGQPTLTAADFILGQF